MEKIIGVADKVFEGEAIGPRIGAWVLKVIMWVSYTYYHL